MWPIEISIVSLIKGPLVIIKKSTDKHIKIPGCPNQYEIQKINFAEMLISLEKYYQCDWKISPKRNNKNHKYIEYIQSPQFVTLGLPSVKDCKKKWN